MIGEAVLASFNFFVSCFDFGSFKWRFSDELCITKLEIVYIMTPTDQISTS